MLQYPAAVIRNERGSGTHPASAPGLGVTLTRNRFGRPQGLDLLAFRNCCEGKLKTGIQGVVEVFPSLNSGVSPAVPERCLPTLGGLDEDGPALERRNTVSACTAERGEPR